VWVLGGLLSFAHAAVLDGWALYADDGEVFRCAVDGKPERLYDGSAEYACWSADGGRIFFMERDGDIWVMNADGSGPRKLGEGKWTQFCPIAVYRPDERYVLYVEGSQFYRVSADDGARDLIHSGSREYKGEVAISLDGARLVARTGMRLYRMPVGGDETRYAPRCSSSISPNGEWLTRNPGDHRTTVLYTWDGEIHKKLKAPRGQELDEQKFAVNSDEYIVFSFDARAAVGVVRVEDNHHVAIGDRRADYPDFFVGALPEPQK
jgi:hypothetical protein